ncbi:unnamed protein product [Diamesa serratosioi]
MRNILKLVCLISVFSAVCCAQFCSNEAGDKGECLSHAVCEQNIPVDGSCEPGRSCCYLKFFDSNCGEGKPTIFQLYTHQIAKEPKLICSGTLINSLFILTAAHCIDQEPHSPLFAKIHGSDREFKISKHFVFPGFANNNTHRLNDVGLFRLEEAIDPTVNAKTVCLPKKNLDLSDATFTIYGMDQTTRLIQETTTDYYDFDDCSDYLDENQFNHTISQQDSFCYNDTPDHVPHFVSGTPIMIKEDNKYYQYGITSLGAYHRKAGVFTLAISPKLSIFQGWILKIVTGMFLLLLLNDN